MNCTQFYLDSNYLLTVSYLTVYRIPQDEQTSYPSLLPSVLLAFRRDDALFKENVYGGEILEKLMEHKQLSSMLVPDSVAAPCQASHWRLEIEVQERIAGFLHIQLL